MANVQEEIGDAIDSVSRALRATMHSKSHLDGHPSGNPDMDDWESSWRDEKIKALSEARSILERAFSR